MLPSQVIRLALAPPLRLLKTFNGIRYLGHDAGIRGAIERLKRPSRGGQNLSDRYIRLEKSLRGKEALSKDLGDLTRPSVAAGSVKPQGKAANNLFRGFEVPEEPRPPQDDGTLTHFQNGNASMSDGDSKSRVLHVRMRNLRVRLV